MPIIVLKVFIAPVASMVFVVLEVPVVYMVPGDYGAQGVYGAEGVCDVLAVPKYQ